MKPITKAKNILHEKSGKNLEQAMNELELSGGAGSGTLDSYIIPETSLNIYSDTAQNKPVDGIGAGASVVSAGLETTSPLFGEESFKLIKSASNGQGEGFSYDLTVDSGILNQPLQAKFTYKTSANYIDSDIGFYIYDIDNSNLMYPSVVNVPSTNGEVGTFLCTFLPSNSLNYRLIWHVQSTSALAYDFTLDNIVFGVRESLTGTAISEWKEFDLNTVSITNLPGSWVNTHYRRVGSEVELDLVWQTSDVASGNVTLNPSSVLAILGLSYKPNLLSHVNGITAVQSTTTPRPVGSWNLSDGRFYSDSQSYWYTSRPFTWVAGNLIQIQCSIPVNEWSTNINLATDFTEYASNDGSGGTSANTTYDTGMVYGPEGSNFVAVDSSSVTSYEKTEYKVSFQRAIQQTDLLIIEVLDETEDLWLTVSDYEHVGIMSFANTGVYGIGIVPVVDDKYSVYVVFGNGGRNQTGASYGATGATWSSAVDKKWRVRKVSNGNMAEQPRTVRAEYRTSTVQDLSALTRINYNTKIEDTHNAVTTGSGWEFKAPIDGIYLVNAGVLSSNQTFSSGQHGELRLYKIASSHTNIDRPSGAGFTNYMQMNGSGTVRLTKGETVHVKGAILGSTGTTHNDTLYNYIMIERIGN